MFTGAIEGSRGTIVFGNGIPALSGEVTAVKGDYVLFLSKGAIYAVPTANIAYYRFRG